MGLEREGKKLTPTPFPLHTAIENVRAAPSFLSVEDAPVEPAPSPAGKASKSPAGSKATSPATTMQKGTTLVPADAVTATAVVEAPDGGDEQFGFKDRSVGRHDSESSDKVG